MDSESACKRLDGRPWSGMLSLQWIGTGASRISAKYTPFEGDIHIETRVADGKVELDVRDNGVGFAKDLNPRIFDLFVQGARSAD